MLVLATRAKKHRFKLDQMPRQGSVLIEDLAFNAIFAAANRSLELVAQDDTSCTLKAVGRLPHRIRKRT